MLFSAVDEEVEILRVAGQRPEAGVPRILDRRGARGALPRRCGGGRRRARRRRLGVTKGSFYWQFENRAELLGAALELWERRGTTEVIDALTLVPDPVDRLRQLFQRVSDAAKGAPSHAALASADDPAVRRTLQRVAAARLEFLSRCYEDLGMAGHVARRRALLAYAAYLGTIQVSRDSPAELATRRAREDYTAHVIETLVPRKRTPRRRSRA